MTVDHSYLENATAEEDDLVSDKFLKARRSIDLNVFYTVDDHQETIPVT